MITHMHPRSSALSHLSNNPPMCAPSTTLRKMFPHTLCDLYSVTDVCLFPGTKLDAPRLGRTASSCVSRSCRAPGGETIRCQIEQDC